MNPANYQPPATPGTMFDVFRRSVVPDVLAQFGTTGAYVRKGGAASLPLRGIWKAPFSNTRLDGFGVPGIEAAVPNLIIAAAELPSPAPARGDSWSDGVTTWYVTEVRPNPAQGLTVLLLSLDNA